MVYFVKALLALQYLAALSASADSPKVKSLRGLPANDPRPRRRALSPARTEMGGGSPNSHQDAVRSRRRADTSCCEDNEGYLFTYLSEGELSAVEGCPSFLSEDSSQSCFLPRDVIYEEGGYFTPMDVATNCPKTCDVCPDAFAPVMELTDNPYYVDPIAFWNCSEWREWGLSNETNSTYGCFYYDNYAYADPADISQWGLNQVYNGAQYMTDEQLFGIFSQCAKTCYDLQMYHGYSLFTYGLDFDDDYTPYNNDPCNRNESIAYTDPVGNVCSEKDEVQEMTAFDNTLFLYYPLDENGDTLAPLDSTSDNNYRGYYCSKFRTVDCHTDSFSFDEDEEPVSPSERERVIRNCGRSCNIGCYFWEELTANPTPSPTGGDPAPTGGNPTERPSDPSTTSGANLTSLGGFSLAAVVWLLLQLL